MTKSELSAWIDSEITLGGAIGIQLPKAEIDRVIDKATNEVYELYTDSLEHKFLLMPSSIFWTPEFRANRTIQFADCVTSVIKFQEAQRRFGLSGFRDGDISWNKAIYSGIFFGSPMNTEWILDMSVAWLSWDQMKTFTVVDIQHHWNRLTHRLTVTGHEPKSQFLVVELMTKVKPEDLYEDPWVRKYIAGKCKVEVTRMIGTFTQTLVGGVNVNSTTYKDEGQAEIDECKEYWKDLIQASWFISFP